MAKPGEVASYVTIDGIKNYVVGAPKPEPRLKQAMDFKRYAAEERRHLGYGYEDDHEHLELAEAFEARAAALMKPTGPPRIVGGEVTRTADDDGPVWEVANTLRDPDQAAIEASLARTDLLYDKSAAVVALGLDLANSIGAENSLEKMMAHQIAKAHVLAMRTMDRALEIERRRNEYDNKFSSPNAVELARLSGAVSRLMQASNDAIATLQKLRRGSAQTVTVRHVTVEQGGQAVIGNVAGGGSRKRRSGRGGKRK